MPVRRSTTSTDSPWRSASSAGVKLVLAGTPGPWWKDVSDRLERAGCGPVTTIARRIDELPVMQDAQRDVRGADAVVLQPGSDTNLSDLMRAAAMLSEWDTPGIVVLNDELQPAHQQLRASGLHVLSQGIDGEIVCALIAGLASRQATVRRMHADMRTSWKAQEQVGTVLSRVEEEARLAARVQRQLLPRNLPNVPGLRFGVVFRPAEYVSGDIFRVERLDDGRIGVLLADVMGHGVRAAMYSILVAQLLPMHDRLNGDFRVIEPGEALARLNVEMARQRQEEANFATAVYALIDPSTWRVRIASAGHPPAVVTDSGSNIEQSRASGPMLGVFDEAKFDEDEFTLEPGRTLVLYSDGIEQALAPAVQPPPKGVALMEEAVRRIASIVAANGADVAAAAQGVHALLNVQTGSLHQGDDVSVLLVRRD